MNSDDDDETILVGIERVNERTLINSRAGLGARSRTLCPKVELNCS
jgi:hypothetical protein